MITHGETGGTPVALGADPASGAGGRPFTAYTLDEARRIAAADAAAVDAACTNADEPPVRTAIPAMQARAAELREIAQAPTLEDLLDVVAAPDRAGLRLSVVLELKGAQWGSGEAGRQAASALLEVLRSRGALVGGESHQQESGAGRGRGRQKARPTVRFSSFEHDALRHIQSAMPDAQTAMLFNGSQLHPEVPADFVARADRFGAQEVHVAHWAVEQDPTLVAKAHKAGLRVMAWFPGTANERLEQLQALLGLGVDAVCCNRPDLMMHARALHRWN